MTAQTRQRRLLSLCFLISGALLVLLYRAGGFAVYTAPLEGFHYGVNSPVDVLSFLFPAGWHALILQWLLLLRSALAGVALCWFLARHMQSESRLLAVLGAVYALGVYTGCVVNVAWADAAVLFPLFLAAIDGVFLGGSSWPLGCMTFLCVAVNCYTVWPLLLCGLLYLVWWWGTRAGELQTALLKNLLRRVLPGLGAGTAAGLALVAPVVLRQLKNDAFRFSGAAQTVQFSLQQVSYCLFYARYTLSSANRGLPYLYSGMAVVALALLFFFNRRAGTRQKFFSVFFLVVLAASYLVELPGISWENGGDVAVFPFRYGFVFSAVLLMFAADTLLYGGVAPLSAAVSLFPALLWAAGCRADAGRAMTNARVAVGVGMYLAGCVCSALREHSPPWRRTATAVLAALLLLDVYASSCITLYGMVRIL